MIVEWRERQPSGLDQMSIRSCSFGTNSHFENSCVLFERVSRPIAMPTLDIDEILYSYFGIIVFLTYSAEH
jgi:hypothetical protein